MIQSYLVILLIVISVVFTIDYKTCSPATGQCRYNGHNCHNGRDLCEPKILPQCPLGCVRTGSVGSKCVKQYLKPIKTLIYTQSSSMIGINETILCYDQCKNSNGICTSYHHLQKCIERIEKLSYICPPNCYYNYSRNTCEPKNSAYICQPDYFNAKCPSNCQFDFNVGKCYGIINGHKVEYVCSLQIQKSAECPADCGYRRNIIRMYPTSSIIVLSCPRFYINTLNISQCDIHNITSLCRLDKSRIAYSKFNENQYGNQNFICEYFLNIDCEEMFVKIEECPMGCYLDDKRNKCIPYKSNTICGSYRYKIPTNLDDPKCPEKHKLVYITNNNENFPRCLPNWYHE